MSRRLDDVRLAVMMLDGIELKGRTNIVALGITTDGVKIPLGLWEGSTENATVATALLSDLVERGLDLEPGHAVRDRRRQGAAQGDPRRARARRRSSAVSATRSATCSTTCPNATGPPSSAGCAGRGPRPDHDRALDQLQALAGELDRTHPGAAASLREGLAETLTLTRLGIRGALKRTLRVDQPCESMIEMRPPHQPQRQALAIRRDGPALDRRRHARSRTPVPQDHRLPRPRQARHRVEKELQPQPTTEVAISLT